MTSLSLLILNYVTGNSGTSSGGATFSDLKGTFTQSLVGCQIDIVNRGTYTILQVLTTTTLKLDAGVTAGTDLKWSVSVAVTNGQTLTVTESPSMGYVLKLMATASENSSTLVNQTVKLDLDYGFGSPAPTLTGSGSVQQTYGFKYAPGTYRVAAKASNFQYPNPQVKVLEFKLTVVAIIPAVGTNLTPVIVGPILPLDDGYPDPEQWDLNISQDDQVLASNLKMLLSTNPGERLMNPTYGTALRSLLFNSSPDSSQAAVQSVISESISTNEPRVKFISASYEVNSDNKSANVFVQTQSLLTRSVIPTTVTISA